MQRPTTVVSALLFFGVAACGGRAGGIEVTHPEEALSRDSVAVTVINDHWYDARVHAVYGGALRYPLGVIGNKREAGPFIIPWHVQSLTMEIDFIIESGRYRTDEIDVEPGDFVQLRIPPNISSSGFFRRAP